MSLNLPSKQTNQWLIGVIAAATAATGGIIYYAISQSGVISQPAPAPSVVTAPVVKKVTALGRLEPEAEIIKLSAPLSLDGDRIGELLVKEGDRVQAGQVIAILDSRSRLQTALQQAQEQVKVAQAKLAQVKAGAKSGEIQAQQATVERLQAQLAGDRSAQLQAMARVEAQWSGEKLAQAATIRKLEAELNNAEAELRRYQKLFSQGAISNSLFDSKRLSVETTRQELNEARANLEKINTTTIKQLQEAKVILERINSTGSKQIREAQATLTRIAEVRPVDVQAAQSEVDNAIASVKRSQTDLNLAYIRAPIAGVILKVHTRPGEKISSSGIVELAQTDRMMAIAEVYQTDIGKVKIGQKATVTSQAFSGELTGIVDRVGLQVERQNVFSNQPGENLDRRVVEVKIRLNPEDSKQVAGLTNLQVQTAIEQ
ncbi:HlyD family secretion protein [[Phormidium ambiguum] IAM M-71]|uniref:HlyD family secretion protein n=1 Tax=[Phormidium ambiguum] IAM M-71 TaxID=454136 RepID=A0A1U7IIU6_9CYAN|nr:ABC exporter membrane fusion protein [Phormidium ambiguum]OKH37044.1 HlyD family secretion protein [Phormidium ambiguum IAM M-71]